MINGTIEETVENKTKIGLVQINNSFTNQNYFPYSVGLLQAYAQKYLMDKDAFEFLLPIYKRIPIKSAEEKLLDADIVFFSAYTWNIKISLEIAKRIKTAKHETLIVFGGPQIPTKNTENFLLKHQFIDIVCHGEGEKSFSGILENYESAKWEKVPSISYIDGNRKFIQTKMSKRISELDTIPSPYLSGVFEPLIDSTPDEEWIALWETNRGCPFSCSYCVWGSATQNKVYAHSLERLYREIDWFSQHKIEFIFCCDANFGILKSNLDIVKYFAKKKEKDGYPKALSVQNTKNSTIRVFNIYKTMRDAGISKGVSLALQSVNTETLKSIKRENISINTFQELQEKFNEIGIETFTDLILGLPDETYDTFLDGISYAIENGQHHRIQFNTLSILVGSEMDDIEYQKKYGLNIVESKLINIHGNLLDTAEIQETQQLVVGTKSMPANDWVKSKVFAYMTSLLYFDKILQIPFIVIHNAYSVSFRELIEIFIAESESYPVLSEIHTFFTNKAIDIQNGDAEFCESKEWLNIWWPADELMLIRLCAEHKLTTFYQEAEQLLDSFLQMKKKISYQSILHDTIFLNQNLIKMPYQDENVYIKTSYDVWNIYKGILKGEKIRIGKGNYCSEIDRTSSKWSSWDDWCREVIWYGNKIGAYLYTCKDCTSTNNEI